MHRWRIVGVSSAYPDTRNSSAYPDTQASFQPTTRLSHFCQPGNPFGNQSFLTPEALCLPHGASLAYRRRIVGVSSAYRRDTRSPVPPSRCRRIVGVSSQHCKKHCKKHVKACKIMQRTRKSMQKHAKSMPKACEKHAKSMRKACKKHAKSMREACEKHAKSM